METDILSTWGVKNMPKRISDAIAAAAKREGLTNAQWLERRVEEWLDAGSPVRFDPVQPSADYIQALAALNRSIVDLASAPDSPLVKTARVSTRALLLADRRRLLAAPFSSPKASPAPE